MNSFLRLRERALPGVANPNAVRWSRAKVDGAPYRGGQVPMLREDEWESLAERTYDVKVGIFDTGQADQKMAMEAVFDAVANGWYKLHREEWKFVEASTSWLVCLVYVIPYTELPPELINGKTQ